MRPLISFQKASQHHTDLAPCIGHHGTKCADMHGDIQHETLILPLHHIGNENKMTAGGNGQKFCNTLNKGKNSEMKYRQFQTPVLLLPKV